MKYPPPSPPYLGPPAHHGPQANFPIRRIVIHSTVSPCEPGGARDIARYFQVTDRDASAHYMIDPSEVIQGLGDSWIAYAAPPNGNTIHLEMCDIPGPVPDDPPWTARWKALRRVWRWGQPNQQRMLRRTARLAADLCLAFEVPPTFLPADELTDGVRGITTHANVSKAWRQTTHWDPGWWPRRRFMRLVRKYIRQTRNEEG